MPGTVRAAIGDKPITQHQFDAFVSIVFNIGPGGFQGSTFLRKFMAGDVQGCAGRHPALEEAGRDHPAPAGRGRPVPHALRQGAAEGPAHGPRADRGARRREAHAGAGADPLAPMRGRAPSSASSGERQAGLSLTKLDPSNAKPAPTGGLVRSGAQATGSATRGLLNSLFAGIHNALARKV